MRYVIKLGNEAMGQWGNGISAIHKWANAMTAMLGIGTQPRTFGPALSQLGHCIHPLENCGNSIGSLPHCLIAPFDSLQSVLES